MRKPITQTLALLTLSLGAGCQYNINIDGDRFSQEDILQCVDQCEDLSDEEQGICIEDCLDALDALESPQQESDAGIDADATEPDATEPDATEPDATEPDATEPTEPDSDGDGLSDAFEAERGTNPENADTDGDGQDDGHEVACGSSPLDPAFTCATDCP